MPTGDHRSGFLHFICAALEDAAQDIQVEVVWKAREIQCEERLASHRVDVAQSVGSRNLAEGVGIVYDRREEVSRADNGLIITHAIDSSIIGCGQTHQEIAIGLCRKGAQYLRELGGAEFACSPRARGQAGQLYGCCHRDTPTAFGVGIERVFATVPPRRLTMLSPCVKLKFTEACAQTRFWLHSNSVRPELVEGRD